MNEELKNKLTERFDKIVAGECDNKDLRDALLKAYIAGGEYGYQYAVEHSDDVIRLMVRMAKKDIAFTEEEAVKFYHEEMKE